MEKFDKKIVVAMIFFVFVTAFSTVSDLVTKKITFDSLGVYAQNGRIYSSDGPLTAEQKIVKENGEVASVEVRIREFPQIHVIEGFFTLVPALNLGGMWGILFGKTVVLILFSFVCIVIIGYMFFKVKGRGYFIRGALGLILGGALGNLYDRLYFGGVRDFLDFDLGFIHWATFNIADVWIVVGVLMILFYEIFLAKKDEKKEPNQAGK